MNSGVGDMQITAFIHAKGTSERFSGKNMKTLGDKPLFCHAIQKALYSSLVTRVIIDSDSNKILDIGEDYGAIALKRPKELADNRTTGDDLAFWQSKCYPDSDIMLHVVPTSPFILPSSIDAAIKLLIDKSVDSVAGVFKDTFYEWKDNTPTYFDENMRIPNSFDLTPIVYETMGLCVMRTKYVLKHKKRINPYNCAPYYLSKIEAIDINTAEDFEFAEIVWHGLRKRF